MIRSVAGLPASPVFELVVWLGHCVVRARRWWSRRHGRCTSGRATSPATTTRA